MPDDHDARVPWKDLAAELGASIGRSQRPVCFVLGAGCSLSAGAPTTTAVDQALRSATQTRLRGLDLRDALHHIPEVEKQEILAPIFAGVSFNAGYLALAALGRNRRIVIVNLNWDTALKNACDRVGTDVRMFDFADDPEDWPELPGNGILDVHVHGIIGSSCRYGRLETLQFTSAQDAWLTEHGLRNTLVSIGASLTYETDMSVLFLNDAQPAGPLSRQPTSRWFFIRDDPRGFEDRLRRANIPHQALTYEVDPTIDFDTVATIIADSAN